MKKLLYGLVVLGALFTTSCGSDDDKKVFGDASVTVDGKTTKMDNITWSSIALNGITSYSISRLSDDEKNTIKVDFQSSKTGTFTIDGGKTNVSFTVDGVGYSSVSGTIVVTAINEDSVKGTFSGKFKKAGSTTSVDASGTFNAETPDITDILPF